MTIALLRGVDRAAFAIALVDRLRSGGVAVSASGAAHFSEALGVLPPRSRRRLYWAARVTLVNRHSDLAQFDAVFAAVFDDAVLALDPSARRAARDTAAGRGEAGGRRSVGGAQPRAGPADDRGLPWLTRVAVGQDRAAAESSRYGQRLPSPLAALAEQPFAEFNDRDLKTLGQWLEQAAVRWPRRRTRRREPHHRGRIDLRASMSRARCTGFEFVRLMRARPRRRPRRIVVLCDVSRSMHGYADIYLHLMRVAVREGDAEVFAFSTTLTRLTPILAQRSAELAIARANERVVDRYGGTHIAGSIAALLSSHHGHTLRGAIVLIASDGWDSDDPADLARAVARVRRRAHRVMWLNPRAGAPGFAPLTGSMAAALSHCDALLPADTLPALRDMLDVVTADRAWVP